LLLSSFFSSIPFPGALFASTNSHLTLVCALPVAVASFPNSRPPDGPNIGRAYKSRLSSAIRHPPPVRIGIGIGIGIPGKQRQTIISILLDQLTFNTATLSFLATEPNRRRRRTPQKRPRIPPSFSIERINQSITVTQLTDFVN